MLNKKAQEEMIGFALIIVLVAVILLAFLGFSLTKSQRGNLEDYEINNFIQSFLQYTSECQNPDYLSVQDLVFECDSNTQCDNGKPSCEVLNETLKGILDNAWPVGEDRPDKGYELTISSEEKVLINLQKGNITQNYKGSSQPLSKRRKSFEILFKGYF